MVGLLVVALTLFSFQQGDARPQSLPKSPEVLAHIEFPEKDVAFYYLLSLSFNPTNDFIYLLNNENGVLYEMRPTGLVQILDTLSFEFSDEKHFMEVSHDGKSIFFWEEGVGEVYHYDIETKNFFHSTGIKLLRLQ